MYTLTRADGTVPPGEHDTLETAMAAAGHSALDDWRIATGLPDQIHTDWQPEYRPGEDGDGFDSDETPEYLRRYWVIDGPGAAHELIDKMDAPHVIGRAWSTWDRQIITAVLKILPGDGDPADQMAYEAAARLAAHYAAAGEVDYARIAAVITRAYNHDSPRLPASEVARYTLAAAEALTARKLAVTGYTPSRVAPGRDT